jgi:hypothetical protein
MKYNSHFQGINQNVKESGASLALQHLYKARLALFLNKPKGGGLESGFSTNSTKH